MRKFFCIFVLMFLVTGFLFGSSIDLGVVSAGEMVINFLQGRVALVIGILMIISGGFLVAMGRGQQSKMLFGGVVIGLGIIVNASNLVSRLFGFGSGMLW